MTEQITYTLILHQIRKKLKLTLMEYCVADCVYHLSNNPKNQMGGWCYASKETISKMLGTTSKTIFDVMKKLIEKQIIEKEPDTKHLKTTSKWFESVVLIRAKAEYKETLHSITKGYSEVSRKVIVPITKGDTIIIDNNKDNNSDSETSPPIPSLKVKENSTHNEITELFDYFKVNFLEEISNNAPIFNWGKCEKLVKPFLKSFGLEKMKGLVDKYFSKNDQFYQKVGWSLEVFLTASTINSLLNGK